MLLLTAYCINTYSVIKKMLIFFPRRPIPYLMAGLEPDCLQKAWYFFGIFPEKYWCVLFLFLVSKHPIEMPLSQILKAWQTNETARPHL